MNYGTNNYKEKRIYTYKHYSKKLEEQTFDIRFFSLVITLDILSVAR